MKSFFFIKKECPVCEKPIGWLWIPQVEQFILLCSNCYLVWKKPEDVGTIQPQSLDGEEPMFGDTTISFVQWATEIQLKDANLWSSISGKHELNPSWAKSAEELEIQYGDIYSTKNDDGTFGVFRILAIEPTVIHCALYSENMAKKPTEADIQNLKPYIHHVPLSVAEVSNWTGIEFIVHRDLAEDDLDGYSYYKTEEGALSKEELAQEIEEIIDFSHEKHRYQLVQLEGNYTLVFIV